MAPYCSASHECLDVVAIDCEMVGVAGEVEGIIENALCKVSLISLAEGGYSSRTLLNTWVRVDGIVIDYRTEITGLDENNLEKLPAIPFSEARDMVSKLITGRIVVGHALENDFQALCLSHPAYLVRDTSLQPLLLPPGRRTVPSLKLLAKYWLNEDMHGGVHDSIQDAAVALRLYMLHALEWECQIKQHFAPTVGRWMPWPESRKKTRIRLAECDDAIQVREVLPKNLPSENCNSLFRMAPCADKSMHFDGSQEIPEDRKRGKDLGQSPFGSQIPSGQVLLFTIFIGCMCLTAFGDWQPNFQSQKFTSGIFQDMFTTSFQKTQKMSLKPSLGHQFDSIKANLEASRRSLEYSIKTLTEEIEQAHLEIFELQMALQRASEDRKKENLDFQKRIVNYVARAEIFKRAPRRLAVFSGSATITQMPCGARKNVPIVLRMQREKSKRATSSAAAIGKVTQDPNDIIANTRKCEIEAQAAYEALVAYTNDSIDKLMKAMAKNIGEWTQARKALSASRSDVIDIFQ